MNETAKPIVWALCAVKYSQPTQWGDGDEIWDAYTNDGEPICSHYSSSRAFGQDDVSPRRKADAYLRVLGTCDPEQIDYRVIPHGEGLPDDVVERGITAGHLTAGHLKRTGGAP